MSHVMQHTAVLCSWQLAADLSVRSSLSPQAVQVPLSLPVRAGGEVLPPRVARLLSKNIS